MKSLYEGILDTDKQVTTQTKWTLLASDPEYFAKEYLKCRNDYDYSITEHDGVKYLSVYNCGVKEIVIDQRFPYYTSFKISRISRAVKIVVKCWDVFAENFKSVFGQCVLGTTNFKYAGMNVRIHLQDPDARYDTYSFDHFDIHGQLVFDKAKSVNFSVLPKVEGDIIFHKKGIGVLNIPFMNNVRSIEIKD